MDGKLGFSSEKCGPGVMIMEFPRTFPVFPKPASQIMAHQKGNSLGNTLIPSTYLFPSPKIPCFPLKND